MIARILHLLRRAALAAAWALAASALGAADPGGIASEPLAAHAHPRGRTLFTLLPPEQTGVRTENPYDDPRMWGDLYQESEGGSLGTGVAIGDYDGDGRPDLFVVSKTGSCRLFRNLGGWKFEDVTEKAGVGNAKVSGVWNEGATFVDVNNDGRLDLYVCRFGAPNLLYINQGDGTFKEMAHAYGLDINDSSVMASFCDYDRDGRLDVYIATNLQNASQHPNGERGHLLHQNRDGTFTEVTERAGIAGESQSHSATWWDYDGDGWPDLYVADDYGKPDHLYRNNRDGTFTDVLNAVAPHTSFYSMGSDLGDVNNDGRIDFLVADMAATTHEKDQHSVAEAREKDLDPYDPRQAPKYRRTALLLNTGVGRCLEVSNLAGVAASNWTWSVRLEDLDNDGRLDLYVTNGFNRDPNPDEHQRSMEAESTAARIRNLYLAPVLVETHLAFRNLGDLRFEEVGKAWGLDQKGVSFGAAFGDLGGDGNLDLVYSNYNSGVTVLRNDEDRGHRITVYLRGKESNRFGVGSLVRVESALGVQVRPLVLARGYMSSSEPMLHFGLGADTEIKRLVVSWPSGHEQVFEHLAVDRRYTITEPEGPAALAPPPAPPPAQFEEVGAAAGLALSSREEAVDEAAAEPLVPLRLNRRGPALAVGARDSSGAQTLVVGGTTVESLRLLRRTAAGFFIPEAGAPPTGDAVDDGPVLLFDAQGKGREDLLVTKGGNSLPEGSPEYQPRLYLSDGQGGYQPAPEGSLPALPLSVGAVAAADFEHNGRLGVFLGARLVPGEYPLPPRSALLANRGGGRFEDVTDQLAPGLREVGMVTSALWSDVDGDGWPDLLLTLDWGQVKCFHNDQGRGFSDWTDKLGFGAAGTGWWTSLAAADFNGDGKPDYVAGNVGLNTQYHADRAHPALLFYGDFKGAGEAPQVLEAYYEGDRLYPWRSRHALGAAIPSVLRRFPTNDAYAKATLEEIVGADKLAAARRFAASELRSGVFLSQPDGTYRFEPLPRLAQIAPLQGLAAGDFDGDGHADIYALENSYAPIPSVGRFDGGLSQLLRGDGHGRFTPVPPIESGLIVPGDAKALALLDLGAEGWPSFLISQNNASTLAFRNRGEPGHHSLRLALHGPPGNPNAIGALLTLRLADGSSQTCELSAGSSLYSQSAPVAFFGFPDSNLPKLLSIRWPNGKSSSLPFSSLPPHSLDLIQP